MSPRHEFLAAHAGHLEIGQHHAEVRITQQANGVLGALRRQDAVPRLFQGHAYDGEHVALIVDGKYRARHHSPLPATGNSMAMQAPVSTSGTSSRYAPLASARVLAMVSPSPLP